MKAVEFVEGLAAATPSKKALMKTGKSAASAEFFASQRCEIRKNALRLPKILGSEELIALFNAWDLRKIEIAGIQFLETPKKTPRGLQIGVDEIHPVLIAPSGEIVIEEAGTKGHRLSEAAANGNKLLEALVILAKFRGERLLGKLSYEDDEAARRIAKECGMAAGGEKYVRFFVNSFGI